MKRFSLIPIFGIGVYIFLFFLAAFLYTGGHESEPTAKGFSWVHNYWCDLMATHKFGSYNEGHLVAKIGHIVITFSVLVFFLVFPYLLDKMTNKLRGVQIFGSLSMLSILFVFTSWHNTSINLMVVFGLIAGILGLIELYANNQRKLLKGAAICLLLNIIGYLMYATNWGIELLPAFQKLIIIVTFAWIIILCLNIRRKALK